MLLPNSALPFIERRQTATASWRSGYAEDCKSLYGGSIPSEASNLDRALSYAAARAPSSRHAKNA